MGHRVSFNLSQLIQLLSEQSELEGYSQKEIEDFAGFLINAQKHPEIGGNDDQLQEFEWQNIQSQLIQDYFTQKYGGKTFDNGLSAERNFVAATNWLFRPETHGLSPEVCDSDADHILDSDLDTDWAFDPYAVADTTYVRHQYESWQKALARGDQKEADRIMTEIALKGADQNIAFSYEVAVEKLQAFASEGFLKPDRLGEYTEYFEFEKYAGISIFKGFAIAFEELDTVEKLEILLVVLSMLSVQVMARHVIDWMIRGVLKASKIPEHLKEAVTFEPSLGLSNAFWADDPPEQVAILQELSAIGEISYYEERAESSPELMDRLYYQGVLDYQEGRLEAAELSLALFKAEFLRAMDPSEDQNAHYNQARTILRQITGNNLQNLYNASQSMITQRLANFEDQDRDRNRAQDHVDFLDEIKRLYDSGRADTIQEAVTVLQTQDRRLKEDFYRNPVIQKNWRVVLPYSYPDFDALNESLVEEIQQAGQSIMTAFAFDPETKIPDAQLKLVPNVVLDGGTLIMPTTFGPDVTVVKIGKAGGYIDIDDRTYYFPKRSQETQVLILGSQLEAPHLEIKTDYQTGSRRRFKRPPQLSVDIEHGHPGSLDRYFGPHGYWTKLSSQDKCMHRLYQFYMDDGLKKRQTFSDRERHLVETAKALTDRNGVYDVAREMYQAVFLDEFEAAEIEVSDQEPEVRHIVETKYQKEIRKRIRINFKELKRVDPEKHKELMDDRVAKATVEEEIEAAVIDELVKTEMQTRAYWVVHRQYKAGDFDDDPTLKEAWERFEEMTNPLDLRLKHLTNFRNWQDTAHRIGINLTAENWDRVADEVFLAAVTMPVTLGAGSLVRGGILAVGRAWAVQSARRKLIVNAGSWAGRYVFEGAFDELQNSFHTNRDYDPTRAVYGMFMSGSFHGGGMLSQRWAKARGITPQVLARTHGWQRAGLQTQMFAQTMAIQTTLATGGLYVDEWVFKHDSDLSLIERVAVSGARMVGYHYGARVINIASGGYFQRVEQRGELRTDVAQEIYGQMRNRGDDAAPALQQALRAAGELVPAAHSRDPVRVRLTIEDIQALRDLGIDLPVPRVLGSHDRPSHGYVYELRVFEELVLKLLEALEDPETLTVAEFRELVGEIRRRALRLHGKGQELATERGQSSDQARSLLSDLGYQIAKATGDIGVAQPDAFVVVTAGFDMTAVNTNSNHQVGTKVKELAAHTVARYYDTSVGEKPKIYGQKRGESTLANKVLFSSVQEANPRINPETQATNLVKNFKAEMLKLVKADQKRKDALDRVIKRTEEKVDKLLEEHFDRTDVSRDEIMDAPRDVRERYLELRSLLDKWRPERSVIENRLDGVEVVRVDGRETLVFTDAAGNRFVYDDLNIRLMVGLAESDQASLRQAYESGDEGLIGQEVALVRDGAIQAFERVARAKRSEQDAPARELVGTFDRMRGLDPELRILFREGAYLDGQDIYRGLREVFRQHVLNGDRHYQRVREQELLQVVEAEIAKPLTEDPDSSCYGESARDVAENMIREVRHELVDDPDAALPVSELSPEAQMFIHALEARFYGPMRGQLYTLYKQMGGIRSMDRDLRPIAGRTREGQTNYMNHLDRVYSMLNSEHLSPGDRVPTDVVEGLRTLSDMNPAMLDYARRSMFDPRDGLTYIYDVLPQATLARMQAHFDLASENAGRKIDPEIMVFAFEAERMNSLDTSPDHRPTPDHAMDPNRTRLVKMPTEAMRILRDELGIEPLYVDPSDPKHTALSAMKGGDEGILIVPRYDLNGNAIDPKQVYDAMSRAARQEMPMSFEYKGKIVEPGGDSFRPPLEKMTFPDGSYAFVYEKPKPKGQDSELDSIRSREVSDFWVEEIYLPSGHRQVVKEWVPYARSDYSGREPATGKIHLRVSYEYLPIADPTTFDPGSAKHLEFLTALDQLVTRMLNYDNILKRQPRVLDRPYQVDTPLPVLRPNRQTSPGIRAVPDGESGAGP